MSDATQADRGDDGRNHRQAVFTITNKRGLHARASSKFVQLAEGYGASITVAKDGTRVGGTSIMGLMLLAAGPGSSIEVTAEGPDAGAALDAIGALIADRFGEGEQTVALSYTDIKISLYCRCVPWFSLLGAAPNPIANGAPDG